MSFAVPANTTTGTASLQVRPSSTIHVIQLLAVALWAAAILVAAVDLRRRRSEHPPSETVQPEWFAPMAPASRRGWHRPDLGGLGAEDIKGDEVWIDV
jgi:hypothetical protein